MNNFGPRATAAALITAGIVVKGLIAFHTGSADLYKELATDGGMLVGAGLLAFQHPTNPAN